MKKKLKMTLIGLAILMLSMIIDEVVTTIVVAQVKAANPGIQELTGSALIEATKYNMIFSFGIKALILIPIMYTAFKSEYVEKFKKFYDPKYVRHFLLRTVMYVALIYVLLIVCQNITLNVFPEYVQTNSVNQDLVNQVSQIMSPYLVIAIVVFIGPFLEEFLYRYIMIDKVLGFLNPALAGLVSIVLFAAVHALAEIISGNTALTIVVILQYLPMSTVFVISYVKEKNIYMSITLHVIMNAIATYGILGG